MSQTNNKLLFPLKVIELYGRVSAESLNSSYEMNLNLNHNYLIFKFHRNSIQNNKPCTKECFPV